MKTAKGNTLIIILILAIIALLFVFVRKEGEDKMTPPTETIPTGTEAPSETPTGGKESAAVIVAGKAGASDLVELSIIPGQSVSGATKVTGTLTGGYFFEGNVLVNIVNKNKTVLKQGYGTATTDWMTSGPVSFSASLDFSGLPAGFAYIAIQNDNPSDDRSLDKIIYVPVVIAAK